ncbi:phosphate ABC transporter substrate-binding protein [Bacillus manliponensis]|uniref:Phosphate-binding protein n=2 Tax=Bacillus manliponensis TaxID=574376 RepID=A0A073JZ52_9BACI|nr:phosphate ABC transporter substrate-binding protein [Bacillus manliponensis]
MKQRSARAMLLAMSACFSFFCSSVVHAGAIKEVRVDGSSTVFPIMEAVAEEYTKYDPSVKISISISGTGGGFHRFGKGEVDLNNASRPIKEEEEQFVKKNQITYTPFQLAYDGLTIIVNRNNTWVDNLSLEELKALWQENGSAKQWSNIHPKWPRERISFYAPGVDSGTYDYFQSIVLEKNPITKGVTLSEDDNVLIRGVQNDKNAIAFVGYAYYVANKDKVKAVSINSVLPTKETIQSGKYSPLSRPLYVYANDAAVQKKASVARYLSFMLTHGGDLVEEVGYVRLPQHKYNEQLRMLTEIEK